MMNIESMYKKNKKQTNKQKLSAAEGFLCPDKAMPMSNNSLLRGAAYMS